LRVAEVRTRESAIAGLTAQADAARAAGRVADAQLALQRAQGVDPTHPRVRALATEVDRAQRRELALREALAAESAGRLADAEARAARLLADWPGDPAARELQRRLRERRPPPLEAPALAASLATKVSLEFRDAPLRSVLEGLSRTHGVNFVFDRDVKVDNRVTLLLREVPLSEGLRIILTTQQLASKTLNERTLFIYPDTAAKQREYREMVTRSFYMANGDVKQAQALVRGIAKSRDIFIDERLNLMIVRDTPDVMRMVERLMASIDVPEPEVVLQVEVLEIASGLLDEAGLQWPDQIQFGLPGVTGQVEIAARGQFRGTVANPAVLATLRETVSRTNTLANPRLRARNREKAKVVVGEKLPVFTTTTTTIGSSASVTYLDVGLKVEVEPTIQLEGDVVMKVALEVSTLIGRVSGPNGAVGYQVGTREASTSIRLRDGETQILAGLIRDEDIKSVSGIPGLDRLPVLGRLFGLHSDTRNKTEIVLLITPRVVRNLVVPDVALGNAPGGSEASPGDAPLRIASGAELRLPPAGATAAAAAQARGRPQPGDAGASAEGVAPRTAALNIAASPQGSVGSVVTVTLANTSDATLDGELSFDAALLQPAQPGAQPGARITFRLAPGQEQVVPMRVLPPAAGQRLNVAVSGLSATDARGEPLATAVNGEATITIERAATPP
jgi:general secretion pathway protein D